VRSLVSGLGLMEDEKRRLLREAGGVEAIGEGG
jgi:hypothetical protein